MSNEEDITQTSNNLIIIANDIDYEKTGKLALLMVVTKNRGAYRMDNGVYVVQL